jgi:molecular chaperone DnaK (HSP70)
MSAPNCCYQDCGESKDAEPDLIGIDFGTTNTVVAVARPGEPARAVTFRDDREHSDLPVCVVLRAIGG